MGKKGLSLEIFPDSPTAWMRSYQGLKVHVSNFGVDSFFFDAQDSRLYMKVQALDSGGRWRDIEYLPNSWCGNSYHEVFLGPGEYWLFAIPEYEGAIKTKIRIELRYKLHAGRSPDLYLYSNTVEAGINPAQFWRKEGYTPRGIMDPYLE